MKRLDFLRTTVVVLLAGFMGVRLPELETDEEAPVVEVCDRCNGEGVVPVDSVLPLVPFSRPVDPYIPIDLGDGTASCPRCGGPVHWKRVESEPKDAYEAFMVNYDPSPSIRH